MKKRTGTPGQVRMGMVGTGRWANRGHLTVYQADPRVKLVAVCDVVRERAEEAARQFGAEFVTTDYRELVTRDDIDAVDVATPNVAHAPVVLAALQAGKHVMCEKPLAMNFAEARQMVRAAVQAGVKTGVNFVYRRHPAAQFAHEIVRRGSLGRIFHINAFYMQSGLVDPQAPLVWRVQKKLTGTGVLGDLGSHIIDLVEWITGEQITRVVADMQTFIKERPLVDGAGMGPVDVDDGTNFLTHFEQGGMGAFVTSRYGTSQFNYQRIEMYGEKGALIYLWEDPDHLLLAGVPEAGDTPQLTKVPVPAPFRPEEAEGWARFNFGGNIMAFITAILEDRDMEPNFLDGLRNQEVMEAIEISAREERWVDLPLEM